MPDGLFIANKSKVINQTITKLTAVIPLVLAGAIAHAAFYQADTMAQYCQEYIKYIGLDSTADTYQAGVCSGYFSSKIEIINLTEELCNKENLNLDAVVSEFIATVESNPEAREQTATYVAVEVLQRKYSCDN